MLMRVFAILSLLTAATFVSDDICVGKIIESYWI
jgi:hypothetical protein